MKIIIPFFRAFRHWEGDTPSNWRDDHRETESKI